MSCNHFSEADAGSACLGGCIFVQVITVGDELFSGVPDVLGGELPSSLNQGDHHIHIPLQIWEEPASTYSPCSIS